MKLNGIAPTMLAAAMSLSLACARQSMPPAPAPLASPPEVGSKAPDFAFTPVTMAGIGKPTKLSALKGQTTVIWFFFKARTRG